MAEQPKQPRWIPSPEDYARADAKLAVLDRMFKTVRSRVLQAFTDRVPLHAIFLFPSRATDYVAYVFYKRNADIEASRAGGIEQELKDAILREFASIASGERGQPTVAVNFDSFENVEEKCNGCYSIYLR
jgi:hypothetical protein